MAVAESVPWPILWALLVVWELYLKTLTMPTEVKNVNKKANEPLEEL